ncbi:hypothetical protein Tco_0267089 [Tanacetum coccineum]
MHLKERQLHYKCMAWFKELKSLLGTLHRLSFALSKKEKQEREVKAIKEIEKWLNERNKQTQEGMIKKGITLDANAEKAEVVKVVSEVKNVVVTPSYDTYTLTETTQTHHMLLPKEDSVHIGKHGLGFENQNDVENPNVLNKAKEFVSQVDVNNDLSKPVTAHYLPKERESTFAKPHHVIASSESRNSSKSISRFSLNYMVHNQYLEEAKKNTQERGRNSRPSVLPPAKSQSIPNDCKPKPRIDNQKSRNWPASKTSCVTIKTSWKVNGENQVVSKSSAVTAADASNKRLQQLDSTLSTSTLASTVTVDGNFAFTAVDVLVMRTSKYGESNASALEDLTL